MRKRIKMAVWLAVLLSLVACTQPTEPVEEDVVDMVAGHWATYDSQTVVLIDLKKAKFQMLQVTEFGLYPVLVAKNLKIESEQKQPQQVVISFDFQGKPTTLKLAIEHNDDGTYYVILVNTLTGKETPLNYVSSNTSLKG